MESDYTIVFDDILTHRKKMVELFCKKTVFSFEELKENSKVNFRNTDNYYGEERLLK